MSNYFRLRQNKYDGIDLSSFKLRPLYFTQLTTSTTIFIDDFFINFDKITNIADLNIIKSISPITNTPIYTYTGPTTNIIIEIQLIYKWGPTLSMTPSPWLKLKINDSTMHKIQFGFAENPQSTNIFLNHFIIPIKNSDQLSFKLSKDDIFFKDTDFSLINGSFICFKALA
jgi:hypothetical protein